MKSNRKAGSAGRRERRAFSAEFEAEAVRLVAERRAKCDSEAFHGSCDALSNLPSFFGFIPNSRAICTCACDNLCRVRAPLGGAAVRVRSSAGFDPAHP